jgi:ParB-like chromosome segregation protein Spo0J
VQAVPVMAGKLEMWAVDRLVPYERNARTHSPEQVAQIAASIQEFGFTNPILVAADAGILAGHGRLAAAKDMGLAEVPVIVLDHLSAEQRRAYVLADNKLALNAGWDEELLQQEIAALSLVDFDLSLMGWSDDELAGLLDPEGIDGDAPPPGADDPGKDYEQKYAVAVECSSESEQETVYEKLNGEGYACRLLTV